MRIKLILLYFLNLLNLSGWAQPIPASKGLFERRAESGLGKDSFYVTRTWFKDSTAIQEIKGYFSYDSSDINIYKDYDVYKYVFFDLRTQKKQDYYSFTDTATLASNYYSETDNCMYSDIHRGSDRFNAMDSLEKITDTIIDHKIYKRIKYKERDTKEYDYRFEYIYYLACNTFKSEIINMNKTIEKIYPGCVIERVDFNSSTPLPRYSISACKIVRNTLTEEEEKVFERWEKNAVNTTKPIITCEEVNKMYTIPIKLRYNPRFMNYNPNKWDTKSDLMKQE